MVFAKKGKKMDGNVLEIRDLRIGEGRPKICIPIISKTAEKILKEAEKILQYPADMVEWRADWFEGVRDPEALEKVIRDLRGTLGNIPLLFTIRTRKEGGELAVCPAEYEELNLRAAKTGGVDLVDVEVFSGCDAETHIEQLHELGVSVIGSSHDFEKTPEQKEIIARLWESRKVGADICKLAVMPRDKDDVLRLLWATRELKRQLDRPLITMSMGRLGIVSRLAGELFGSDVTFGTAGEASAPGQIRADLLRDYLELLHEGPTAEDVPSGLKKQGHIFLIGFMGAGKSTVAEALKQKLGWPVIEMDARIEEEAGICISSMFEQYGEIYFRNKETDLLLSLEKEIASIVSCGGGAVVRPENCAFMKAHGKIVLLTATPETVYERVKDSRNRPVLNGNMNVEYIRSLQEKRRVLYESVADVTVATDGKEIDAICEEILRRLEREA